MLSTLKTQRIASAHRHCIYLLEPDVISSSTLYFLLSDHHDLYEFADLKEFAVPATRQVPDIVIVNAMLVAEYGEALIQRWRLSWPGVKVLIICEACDAGCITAARANGADDTLLRPFDRLEIQRKLSRFASDRELSVAQHGKVIAAAQASVAAP